MILFLSLNTKQARLVLSAVVKIASHYTLEELEATCGLTLTAAWWPYSVLVLFCLFRCIFYGLVEMSL